MNPSWWNWVGAAGVEWSWENSDLWEGWSLLLNMGIKPKCFWKKGTYLCRLWLLNIFISEFQWHSNTRIFLVVAFCVVCWCCGMLTRGWTTPFGETDRMESQAIRNCIFMNSFCICSLVWWLQIESCSWNVPLCCAQPVLMTELA